VISSNYTRFNAECLLANQEWQGEEGVEYCVGGEGEMQGEEGK
jgi:hypothetical protein